MKLINKFVNSISATLSLPSATLPLPLLNILPLPFPGVFDRPAKINKPIVKLPFEAQTLTFEALSIAFQVQIILCSDFQSN